MSKSVYLWSKDSLNLHTSQVFFYFFFAVSVIARITRLYTGAVPYYLFGLVSLEKGLPYFS